MNGERKKLLQMLAVLALVGSIGVTGCRMPRAGRPLEIALCFHPFVGEQPLVLNEPRYPNPGGEGRFKVRDFQFFLSNIRLVSPTGEYIESDSYHLVRFDGEAPGFTILLKGVPRQPYERIEFGIGVDAAANRSLASRGDLDPNGRMAWTWEVGYKFVLLEGALVRGNASDPLVYHVGFSENYTPISVALPRGVLDTHPARLDFRADVLRLFQGTTNIDMAKLPTVKFDRVDAALLGRNFSTMVTSMWPAH